MSWGVLIEPPQSLSVALRFSNQNAAKRFGALLSKNRPEFEEDVADFDLPWFKLLNDWPYPASFVYQGNDMALRWTYSWLRIADLVRLSQLEGVEVLAAHEFLKGPLCEEEHECSAEENEVSLFYHFLDGRMQRLGRSEYTLKNGYTLTHVSETVFDDLWALLKEKNS